MTFGQAVRSARRERGQSQWDLALAIGTTQRRIWAIEAGAEQPGAEVLLRLASALGLEVRFGPYAVGGGATLAAARS